MQRLAPRARVFHRASPHPVAQAPLPPATSSAAPSWAGTWQRARGRGHTPAGLCPETICRPQGRNCTAPGGGAGRGVLTRVDYGTLSLPAMPQREYTQHPPGIGRSHDNAAAEQEGVVPTRALACKIRLGGSTSPALPARSWHPSPTSLPAPAPLAPSSRASPQRCFAPAGRRHRCRPTPQRAPALLRRQSLPAPCGRRHQRARCQPAHIYKGGRGGDQKWATGWS